MLSETMVFGSLKLINWLLEYPSLVAFGSVTSLFEIKIAFFSKTTRWICAKFFQD